MKKKIVLVYILAASMMLSLGGCRAKVAESETETSSVKETESETETEKKTEKQSETQKATEKSSASSRDTASSRNTSSKDKTASTEKTTVKPSTIPNNTQTSESQQPATEANAGTQMCPYCYQQISLASDGQGSTIYADHVAQEKAWSDYMNSTESSQTTPSTDGQTSETQSTNSDTAQCPYCYQYFTVSDGSYSAHLDSENANLGLPEGSDYITCPLCGNTYQRGVEYDTHYCTGVNHE